MRAGIKETSRITGISEWELRSGSKAGKYPHFRIGGPNGRLIFDIEILEEHIRKLMLQNLKEEESPQYGRIRQVK